MTVAAHENVMSAPKRAGRPRRSETEYPCGHPRTAENSVGKGCRTCKRAINARHYQHRKTPHAHPAPARIGRLPRPQITPAVAAVIEACRPEYIAAVEELSGQLDLGLLFGAFPRQPARGAR